MKKLILFIILSLAFASQSIAETNLEISATNGVVIAYYASSTFYMLSTARIFDRPNGTRINCFGKDSEVTLLAIPKEGFVFDYWSGSLPIEGIKTKIILTGDQSYEAHFRAVDEPVECPDCPVIECPECDCPVTECPEPELCPDCICAPCPVADPCPEVVIPPCPDPPAILPCPECKPCKEDEVQCFIGGLRWTE